MKFHGLPEGAGYDARRNDVLVDGDGVRSVLLKWPDTSAEADSSDALSTGDEEWSGRRGTGANILPPPPPTAPIGPLPPLLSPPVSPAARWRSELSLLRSRCSRSRSRPEPLPLPQPPPTPPPNARRVCCRVEIPAMRYKRVLSMYTTS